MLEAVKVVEQPNAVEVLQGVKAVRGGESGGRGGGQAGKPGEKLRWTRWHHFRDGGGVEGPRVGECRAVGDGDPKLP